MTLALPGDGNAKSAAFCGARTARVEESDEAHPCSSAGHGSQTQRFLILIRMEGMFMAETFAMAGSFGNRHDTMRSSA